MKLFNDLSKTARIMIAWVVAVCLILLTIGLLAAFFIYPFENYLSFTAGIALGCAHSVVKVVLLEFSINKTIDMEKASAQNMGRLLFVGRYFLTAAVFTLVILSRGLIGLFGTIAGVLSLQIAALITGNIIKNKRIR